MEESRFGNGCAEKDQLERRHKIAAAEYDRLRNAMTEHRGTSSEADYRRMCYEVEEALDRCKFTQNKIDSHHKEHGC